MLQQLIRHLTEQSNATSWMEWLAFLFGVLQVWLALKNKTINFYAGILSVSLYIVVFYQSTLYAESLLNIYYLLVSIAGIFLWKQQEQSKISRCTINDWKLSLLIASTAWIILFLVLNYYTQSTVPAMDAFVTATAWAGTWLLIRRKLENWLVLNISNVVAIPLQFYKGLELTSLLTFIYLVMAFQGYRVWRKEMSKT